MFAESSTPSWKDCSEALEAVRQVVAGLVDFINQHGSRKLQDPTHAQHAKYKISMCRDLTFRGNCPRGTNCTFAHSTEELEKYRAKNRKTVVRNKEHRMDNQSPSEKPFLPVEDFFQIPNTQAVNPVTLPTIVSIPRLTHDGHLINTTYPTTTAYPTQPVFGPNASTIAPDIYTTNLPSLPLTNGNQFYVQPEFGNANTNHVNDLPKRSNWEQLVSVKYLHTSKIFNFSFFNLF